MHADQIAELETSLPPIIARCEIPRLLGGVISAGRLANLDSEGKGPRQIAVGRRIAYSRADFIAWLVQRSAVAQPTPAAPPPKRGPGRPRKVQAAPQA